MICFRCGATNFLYNVVSKSVAGEKCSSCGHPFTRCHLSFDVLPLVAFRADPRLSDDEAIKLIQETPPISTKNHFDDLINRSLENQIDEKSYEIMIADSETLNSLNRTEVFVCRNVLSTERVTFYRNMIPDIAIAMSPACNLFFHEGDFEMNFLQYNVCPFTKQIIEDYGHI